MCLPWMSTDRRMQTRLADLAMVQNLYLLRADLLSATHARCPTKCHSAGAVTKKPSPAHLRAVAKPRHPTCWHRLLSRCLLRQQLDEENDSFDSNRAYACPVKCLKHVTATEWLFLRLIVRLDACCQGFPEIVVEGVA